MDSIQTIEASLLRSKMSSSESSDDNSARSAVLNQDIKMLRQKMGTGNVTCKYVRSIAWRLFLEYLPLHIADWNSVLASSRKQYRAIVESLIPRGSSFTNDPIYVDVVKDVLRTQTNHIIFQSSTDIDIIEPKCGRDRLARVLFVYSKLNKSVGYVQGMNEIAAILFIVFCNSETSYRDSEQEIDQSECDTLFCFSEFMQRNNHFHLYCQPLDDTAHGVIQHLDLVFSLLSNFDPCLFNHLNRLEIRPQHFLFRWMLLIFAQDLPLSSVIKIWDVLLAEEQQPVCRSRALPHHLGNYIFTSLQIELRVQILKLNDFGDVLHLLQNIPPDIDIARILHRAKAMKVAERSASTRIAAMGSFSPVRHSKTTPRSNPQSKIKNGQFHSEEIISSSPLPIIEDKDKDKDKDRTNVPLKSFRSAVISSDSEIKKKQNENYSSSSLTSSFRTTNFFSSFSFPDSDGPTNSASGSPVARRFSTGSVFSLSRERRSNKSPNNKSSLLGSWFSRPQPQPQQINSLRNDLAVEKPLSTVRDDVGNTNCSTRINTRQGVISPITKMPVPASPPGPTRVFSRTRKPKENQRQTSERGSSFMVYLSNRSFLKRLETPKLNSRETEELFSRTPL